MATVGGILGIRNLMNSEYCGHSVLKHFQHNSSFFARKLFHNKQCIVLVELILGVLSMNLTGNTYLANGYLGVL